MGRANYVNRVVELLGGEYTTLKLTIESAVFRRASHHPSVLFFHANGALFIITCRYKTLRGCANTSIREATAIPSV